jgi:hypothetical protein
VAADGGDGDRKLELLGWCLFIVSALFFIASTARSGDVIGFVGSLFFLFACLVFLVPYLRRTE